MLLAAPGDNRLHAAAPELAAVLVVVKTEGAYAAGDAASNVYNKAQKAGGAWAA